MIETNSQLTSLLYDNTSQKIRLECFYRMARHKPRKTKKYLRNS